MVYIPFWICAFAGGIATVASVGLAATFAGNGMNAVDVTWASMGQTLVMGFIFDRMSTLLAPAPSDTFAQRLRHLLFGHRGHHWMYDANSLTALLHANGFPSVSVLAAGETTIPFPTQIDLHERADESIYAECRRG